MDAEDDRPRFELYVKKSFIDDGPRGSCPFSLKAYMFLTIVAPENDYKAHPVDLMNKPFYMMKLNPAGSVPILVDHSVKNKVVTDSADIVKYLNDVYKPKRDMCIGMKCEANDVTQKVFGCLCKLILNDDSEQELTLREALCKELGKIEKYLKSCTTKYLVTDELTEPDCNFLPKLFQIVHAGNYFCSLKCLNNYPAIRSYFERGQQEEVWKNTSPLAEDIVEGFKAHGATKHS